MKLFVDTNILLDVIAKRKPFYKAAALVWGMAERHQVEASISTISINNVYYIVRKSAGKQKADAALVLLRDIFDFVAPDRQIVNQAIDSSMDDFEDAVQFYSAIRIQADYLVTRNAKHFPTGDIPVMAPDEFLATLSTQDQTKSDASHPG